MSKTIVGFLLGLVFAPAWFFGAGLGVGFLIGAVVALRLVGG